MRLLKPGGKALIYVWAYEQEYNKQKSKYLKEKNKDHHENLHSTDDTLEERQEPHVESVGCRRHLGNNPVDSIQDVDKVADGKLSVHTNRTAFNTQDLLVPWHLKEGKSRDEVKPQKSGKKKTNTKKSKLTSDNSGLPSTLVSETESDCDRKSNPEFDTNISSPSDLDSTEAPVLGSECDSGPMPVFHRYYHVFQQGELEQLCGQVMGAKVRSSYHDQGNWCVILEKE